MACDLCPPYSFMVRPRLQAVLPHDKVNLHCLEQRSREHMYPEVNKTLTGIHDSEVAPGLRPQALCPTALGSQVPFHPSGHLQSRIQACPRAGQPQTYIDEVSFKSGL